MKRKYKLKTEEEKRQEGFATRKEAAQFLRLTTRTIDIMIRRDDLPVVRFGHAVRIPWHAIHDLVPTTRK